MLQSSDEGQFDLTSFPPGFIPLQRCLAGTFPPPHGSVKSVLFLHFLHLKGYQWLKERVNSEEGRRQLIKIKELHLLADRLSCTAAQLAIGMTPSEMVPDTKWAFDPFNMLQIQGSFSFLAWCLRSEGVSSVLLGVSTTDQLLENLGALRVIFVSNLLPHKSIVIGFNRNNI